MDLANETCRGSDLSNRDLVGVGNTWFQVVGVSSKLQDGGGGLYLPLYHIPTPFPSSFSTHSILPLPSYNAPGVLGTGCVCLRCVVVERRGGECEALDELLAFGLMRL